MKPILVLGSTSFVGRLFCRELLTVNWFPKCEFVFSARSPEKFQSLHGSLPDRFSFLKLDLCDTSALKAAIQNSFAVINFAGPFESGSHYLDITGEIPFYKGIIEKFHLAAQSRGVSIVPACGFDSVPSDTLANLLVTRAQDTYRELPRHIQLKFQIKGGFNGGTLASIPGIYRSLPLEELKNPRLFTAHLAAFGSLPRKTHRDLLTGRSMVPFFMESINEKVVYRSLESRVNVTDVLYEEIMPLSGPFSPWIDTVVAKSIPLIEKGLAHFFRSRWANRVLHALGPAPGEGPSVKAIENGFARIVGTAITESGHRVAAEFMSRGDPGNKTTYQCVLGCLDALLACSTHQGGVLTPFQAWGDPLAGSLRKFEIEIA